jgi:hypothetical protein
VSFATPQPEDDGVISQQRELGEANSSARRILAKVTPCLARCGSVFLTLRYSRHASSQ